MFKQKKSVRPLSARRAATLLCAALAGLGLARGAAAQQPLPNSPAVPTPYQSPLFHSGGAQDPNTGANIVPALPDLLDSQLQGTPTGISNGVPTQIPSFLLGDYSPGFPPSTSGVYYPNHFADGSFYSWQAPFDYVPLNAGYQQVDDFTNGNAFIPPGPGATNGFTATNGWQRVTLSGGVGPLFSEGAGTAINSEYLLLAPNTNGTATWQLVVPAPTATTNLSGNYTVSLNIPNDLPDTINGNSVAEIRSTNVLYFITVRDAAGVTTSTTTATASQTDANSNEYLAGPFFVAAGGTVTVTLSRDSARRINNGNYNLVADQMVLQTAIGDVQSTPTAINYESYPADFALAKYWGIYVAANGTAVTVPSASAANNAAPDNTGGTLGGGAILFHVGDPAQAKTETGAADPTGRRRIRQLVYFGRSEPQIARSVTVDDNSAATFSSIGGSQVPNAVTASNGEYGRFGVATGFYTTASVPVGVWTLTAPTGASGSYFVNVHIPRTPVSGDSGYPETRLGRVTYTVTYVTIAGTTVTTGPATISQAATVSDFTVTLPTGALHPAPGSAVKVNLYNLTGATTPPANNSVVVADSVSLTTGSGQGAIYCVDGFTGGVVWRFEVPASANGASAAVFSSPAVAKINVLVPQAPSVTTPPVYKNTLVVIVGDNNGLLYCLDAIGNGDGTSNSQVLDPTTGGPIYAAQPAYGAAAPAFDPAAPHVGTTPVYWIYRPDAARPKVVTGTTAGTVKSATDANTDLPVPAAFGSASPTVFVDPNKTGTPDPTTHIVPLNADGTPPSNATVYVGNSNGVLYALDATGVATPGAASFAAIGDTFNVPQDLRADTTVFPAIDADPIVPSCQPKWWFTLRGPDPNSGTNTSAADIESAPALRLKSTADAAAPSGFDLVPTVYIGSAHEQEASSNVGRLYALNGLYGPSGNSGKTDPSAQPDPTLAGYTGPGSFNYNVGQHAPISATDTNDWAFPDAYGTGKSSDKQIRSALGNITGSPVVFTNPDETDQTRRTRIYFAANSGYEASSLVLKPTARPDAGLTGRIWAVNLDGSVGTTTNQPNGAVWSYPLAKDPNLARNDPTSAAYVQVAEPQSPIGAFLHGTPAMGFVQFPAATTGSDPSDQFGVVNSRRVPMLYVGTRGSNDTALYAIDVDGNIDAATATSGGDHRLIYRQPSPNGSIFQSSPILITNNSTSGGNGGSVFITAGDTFYDFTATPLANPITTEAFPLIRENREFIGFGPFSSPTVAATSTYDLLTATENAAYATLGYGTNDVTDWVYVGDSSTGFCRGITPQDSSYSGIPSTAFDQLIPPSVDSPGSAIMDAFIQALLMPDASKGDASTAAAYDIGKSAPLPVYEWGQSVYIRFDNVVPPNPTNDPTLYVYDHIKYPDFNAASPANLIPVYTNGQAITFTLSNAVAATTVGVGGGDNGSDARQVPPVVVTAYPADGFMVDTSPKVLSPPSPASSNLTDSTGTPRHWQGAYTYTIADGSASHNTPGSRRTINNISQTVTQLNWNGSAFLPVTGTTVLRGNTTNGNEVSTPVRDAAGNITGYAPTLTKVDPVDQPTFGILNPLAVRGGGVDLLNHLVDAQGQPTAVRVGSDLGPYRGITDGPKPGTITPNPTAGSAASYDLQALANGNDVPISAPPSSSGGGQIDPTKPLDSTANAAYAPPLTVPTVVVTTTGLIGHGKTGDNADPSALDLGTDVPTTNFGSLNGLTNADTQFGAYALNIFDRGNLGPGLGQTLRAKMIVTPPDVAALPAGTVPPSPGEGLYWNDNSGSATGRGAVVNYLPWETPPTSYQTGSANPSQDYPDISGGNLAAIVHYPQNGGTADLNGTVDLTPAQASGNSVSQRILHGDSVQTLISIPRFQPANQQLYQRPSNATGYDAGLQKPPVDDNGVDQIVPANYTFPMGYIASKRLYVPDRNGNRDDSRPFRDVRVYTGVPPDFSTTMDNPTVEIIKVLPSAFGVQTNLFPALVDPPSLANPPGSSTFDPYNAMFQGNPLLPDHRDSYFQPLDAIHNVGNVNLLNVHLDQKRQIFGGNQFPLPLVSDTVDPLSDIAAYDYGGVTGPRAGIFPGSAEEPYLVRSSLDGDLVAAFGHNPNMDTTIYPGATFHKARVGSGQPSTLTVPDAPEAFVPGASLDVPDNGLPTHRQDPNNGLLFKAVPYVSVAVPFGTPVGNYTGSLQLFEGLDSTNNLPSSGDGTYSGPIALLYPPRYGRAVGGIGTPDYTNTPDGLPINTVQIAQTANGPVPLMPVSRTGTVLKLTVGEDRMTDGNSYGSVNQIDGGPAGLNAANAPVSLPDFGPSAFRDPVSGNLSLYWTSARPLAASTSPYNILGANVKFHAAESGPGQQPYFVPSDPAKLWWNPFSALTGPGTNSGLTIAEETLGANSAVAFGFGVNVQTGPYQNTLFSYPVTLDTGALGSGVPITNDFGQVKYGVKGLSTRSANFARNLWAFWTAQTRGRTAIYYNSQDANGQWIPTAPAPSTTALLPVPAGLTAVADPAPLLTTAPVTVGSATALQPVIAVTYSGTAPSGNGDLYESRYQPDTANAAKLVLVPFPSRTEILTQTGAPGSWYQARDVAWARTEQLNLSVRYVKGGSAQDVPILYNAGAQVFTKAVFDRASGLLVLTGVAVPDEQNGGTHTVYVDYATGRVRFSPALNTTTQALLSQSYEVRALFSPLARRITNDSRADTGANTFLDTALKINDAANLNTTVEADRRWYVWRKSGVGGDTRAATIFYKTQRLTAYLPFAVDTTKAFAFTVNGTAVNPDIHNVPAVLNDNNTVKYRASARLYFPIASGAEGAVVGGTYTATDGSSQTVPADIIQWQDEQRANDAAIAVPDTAAGLSTVFDYTVPMSSSINESNVSAFLDPFANATTEHKVWLFWNSTRNGTADIYYETINPRFAAGP